MYTCIHIYLYADPLHTYIHTYIHGLTKCTGTFLLVTRVTRKTHSVQGLSLKTQLLYLCVFTTRLLFKIFYEKDYTYAAVEVVATILTMYLVILIRFTHRYKRMAAMYVCVCM
jgi:hypothetical protein